VERNLKITFFYTFIPLKYSIATSFLDAVRKSERTTGVTTNIVFDTDATVKVWYTLSKWAIFYDQILVYQPFIQSGDSRSLVDKVEDLSG